MDLVCYSILECTILDSRLLETVVFEKISMSPFLRNVLAVAADVMNEIHSNVDL